MTFDPYLASLLDDERRREAERIARAHALLARAAPDRPRSGIRRTMAVWLAGISRASAAIARRLDASSVDPRRVGRSPRIGA